MDVFFLVVKNCMISKISDGCKVKQSGKENVKKKKENKHLRQEMEISRH